MWSSWSINQHAGTSNIKREFLSTDSMMKSAWESSSMYWNLTIRDTKMQTSADSSLSGCFCLYDIYLDNLHSSTQAHLINHFFRVARFRLRLGTCLVTKPGSMSYRNFLLGFFWAKFFQKCQNYADTAIHRFISDYYLWHVSFTSWFLTAFIIWSYQSTINKSPTPKKNIFGKFKLRVNFVLDVPVESVGFRSIWSQTWRLQYLDEIIVFWPY